MIQLITSNEEYKNVENKNYTISELNSFSSFKNNILNIIDLNYNKIWKNDNASYNYVNIYKDLGTIGSVIKESNSNALIILPSNLTFYYKQVYSGKYENSIELKDFNFLDVLSKIIEDKVKVIYGKNKTKVNNKVINSDFYFSDYNEYKKVLTSSNKEDVVAIKKDNLTITTLNPKNLDEVDSLVKNLYPDLFNDSEEIPE